MHICASFPTQKTSRQHEVMPRFGGRFFKDCVVWEVNGEVLWIWDWDCKRTRTTSKGVTGAVSVGFRIVAPFDSPSNPVKTLPAVADTMRCPGVIFSTGAWAWGADGEAVPEIAIVESSSCDVHDAPREVLKSSLNSLAVSEDAKLNPVGIKFN